MGTPSSPGLHTDGCGRHRTGSAEARVVRLQAQVSHLAQSLYTSESSLDIGFVRTLAGSGAASGRTAAELVAAVADVWTRYPLLRDSVEQLVGAVADHRHHEVERLLRSDAIPLPAGAATGAEELVIVLQRQIDDAVKGAAHVAATARAALVQLDAAATELIGLVDRATAIGSEDDPEISGAREQLDRAAAAFSADPTTAPPGDLDAVVIAARTRVEVLEQQRADLPAALAAARSQLERLRSLIGRGAEALGETTQKISGPTGLLQPCDPSVLEGHDRALEPWLTRIEHHASTGRWVAAARGLEHWRQVADAWSARAQRVLEANRAPLDRRNELRGLLTASQAKAAAQGRAEEADLVGLAEAARDGLYVAPCDLTAATCCVEGYVDALRSTPTVIQP